MIEHRARMLQRVDVRIWSSKAVVGRMVSFIRKRTAMPRVEWRAAQLKQRFQAALASN
jgi:hypothetical protein